MVVAQIERPGLEAGRHVQFDSLPLGAPHILEVTGVACAAAARDECDVVVELGAIRRDRPDRRAMLAARATLDRFRHDRVQRRIG